MRANHALAISPTSRRRHPLFDIGSDGQNAKRNRGVVNEWLPAPSARMQARAGGASRKSLPPSMASPDDARPSITPSYLCRSETSNVPPRRSRIRNRPSSPAEARGSQRIERPRLHSDNGKLGYQDQFRLPALSPGCSKRATDLNVGIVGPAQIEHEILSANGSNDAARPPNGPPSQPVSQRSGIPTT
jgi:hypothetical protein